MLVTVKGVTKLNRGVVSRIAPEFSLFLGSGYDASRRENKVIIRVRWTMTGLLVAVASRVESTEINLILLI